MYWVASTCNTAPAACARAATCATGIKTPVSLLAAMSDTSATSGPISCFVAARSSVPSGRTGMKSTCTPLVARARASFSWPACSTALNRTRLRCELAAPSKPRTARWLASVAPLVKITSTGLQPSTRATVARALANRRLASCPGPCCDEVLAHTPDITGSMAAITAGASGVVALWSR